MPFPSAGSAPPAGSKPKESRRWLKPRVPKEQLYRLSPPRPKRERLGHIEAWDRARHLIRSWWIWLAVAIVAILTGFWVTAVIAGALSFFCYQTSPEYHPAIYALETDLDVSSAEFPITMTGMTGMPLMEGNRVTIYNGGDEFFPAMLDAIDAAKDSVTME
ncbi:MAG: hypothetical protein ACRD5L_18775, partial [Bryobacteraceae bacterium]